MEKKEIILEDVKKEAEEKWSKLSLDERLRLQQEFNDLTRDFIQKSLSFSRNLPKNRDIDYINYVNPSIKHNKAHLTISENQVK